MFGQHIDHSSVWYTIQVVAGINWLLICVTNAVTKCCNAFVACLGGILQLQPRMMWFWQTLSCWMQWWHGVNNVC